jgi:eukaryotic-like serine/threonine-protein kinase
MYSVLLGAPEAPSAHRPDVPPDLDAIVLCGMAKDPADRFETAKAMAAALEAAVPTAKRSAVTEWVAACARDDMEARRQRVARVEGDLTVVPAPSMPPPPPRASRDAATPTFTPGASPALPPSRAGRRPPSTLPLGVVAAAAIGGATAMAILVAGRATTPVVEGGNTTALFPAGDESIPPEPRVQAPTALVLPASDAAPAPEAASTATPALSTSRRRPPAVAAPRPPARPRLLDRGQKRD